MLRYHQGVFWLTTPFLFEDATVGLFLQNGRELDDARGSVLHWTHVQSGIGCSLNLAMPVGIQFTERQQAGLKKLAAAPAFHGSCGQEYRLLRLKLADLPKAGRTSAIGSLPGSAPISRRWFATLFWMERNDLVCVPGHGPESIWPAGAGGDNFDPGIIRNAGRHVAWNCPRARLWSHGLLAGLSDQPVGKQLGTTANTLYLACSALINRGAGGVQRNSGRDTTLW